jgi:ABC-type nitrate/sulfonate/bicarbonate transport system substrate-binding protein
VQQAMSGYNVRVCQPINASYRSGAEMTVAKVLIATVAVTSLSTGVSAVEMMKARLAQNLSPISGVILVAEQKGFFAKNGLDLTTSNFSTGKQCLDTVIGGAADIATTAESPITAAMLSKQPIAFLARMEYSDDKTLTAVSAKINTWTDLKGKRIGYTAGTGSEIYTATLLAKANLTTADVTLVNLRPQDMVAALATGSIDAYDTWEPHISFGKKTLGDKVKELNTAGVYSETFNIVVMQDYLKSNRELIEKFLAAMIEAEAWMKTNREDAITVIANIVGMKRDDLAPIWNDYVYHVTLDQKQLDILKMHSTWRLTSGNHPSGVTTLPDFGKFIAPGSLRAVAPDRVSLPAGWDQPSAGN